MLARRLLRGTQLWRATTCGWTTAVRHTQSANQVLNTLNLEMRLPVARKKEPQRQPFVKNLFLGVFDYEFMYFPEPQTKERHQQFMEWLAPIERYMMECLANPQGVTRNDVLARLRDLGVFRAAVEEQYFGLSMSQTELAKLVEVLAGLYWLGSYFVKNHIIPMQIISALASDKQKAKYLPRIVTGDLVPTICTTEPGGGFGIRDFGTKAILSECDTYWLLNGEKSFVANGSDANLFLVFNACCYDNQPPNSLHKSLSLLLVERDFNGITCKDVKSLAGQQNSSICTITFENTKVPNENLLGNVGSGMNILVSSLAPGNRFVAPQAIAALRTFMKLLITHILERKHLDQNMHDYEIVQEVIGRIATKLYSMESVLYMTTGIVDSFIDQDCELEKAIVEAYCTNECVACIYEGMQIIGVQSYLREYPYMQILEDALSYALFDCYNVDSSTYISLLGLQHTGKNLHQHIYKLRNLFQFPTYDFKWLNPNERLKIHLNEHMHPSLIFGSKLLEECLGKLLNISVLLLERHGREISERQMELRRLSEITTKTYALIAVLSRSSRAYCIGLRNADEDRQLAGSFSIFISDQVRRLASEIKEGEWNNGDKMHKNIAELMYKKKDYFAEHPLSRTY